MITRKFERIVGDLWSLLGNQIIILKTDKGNGIKDFFLIMPARSKTLGG